MSEPKMLTRRSLLGASGALLAGTHALRARGSSQAAIGELFKPPALRAGDAVGVITPATYVSDPDRLALIGRTLAHFNLRPKMGERASRRMGDYRASVTERVDDLHAAFRDPEVRGIFCVRGGYGAAHCLTALTTT
ncbi:MAG: LD-carboxypeptidase [Pyrinomonadaceae bacterium]